MVTPPDVTPRLHPCRHERRFRRSTTPADRFAHMIDKLDDVLEPGIPIHVACIDEIRRYPEAVAMADRLEHYAAGPASPGLAREERRSALRVLRWPCRRPRGREVLLGHLSAARSPVQA